MSATEIMWLSEYARKRDSQGEAKDCDSLRARKLDSAIEALSACAHLKESVEGLRKPRKD